MTSWEVNKQECIARCRNKQILDWPVDCPIIKWTAHITERGLFARIFKAKVNYQLLSKMNRKFSQQIAGNMGYRLPTAFDQVSTKFTTINAKNESLTSN